MKTLNSLLYTYLWNDKREKIKRSILINTFEGGGLNMVDIESFYIMLQIKWVKSLLSTENTNWKAIPKYYLDAFGPNFLVFYMNLCSIKQLPEYQRLPSFYSDLIQNWFKFRNIDKTCPRTFFDIRKQLIWGNDLIKHDNKPLFFHNWIKSKLLFVNDVINEHGEINEHFILTKLDNKVNWISEISILRNSLPKEWKRILKQNNSNKTKVRTKLSLLPFQSSQMDSFSNKHIYTLLINNKKEKPYMHSFWSSHFNTEITWNLVYLNIKSLSDNRYKQFRYKTIHNIIPTGQNLYRWKLKSNPYCNICNEVDNMEHLFVRCSLVTNFWNRITDTFKALGINKEIRNIKSIVIGYNTENASYYEINLIFSIIGFTIYKMNILRG